MSKQEVKTFDRTDSGNAELFTYLFSKQVRYDHTNKRWLLWAGHWWQEDKRGKVYDYAKRVGRHRKEVIAKALSGDRATAEYKYGNKDCGKESSLNSLLRLASKMEPISTIAEDWNGDPFLLGVANGVVNLRTGEFGPGAPEQLITSHTRAAYTPEAKCERWERFLNEVFQDDKELVHFIHKAVGYSLTDDTSEQCFFICHGDGGNGKSTMFDTIKQTFGEYAKNTPFSTFEQKSKSAIPHDVADLVGSRFVTSSESNENDRLNETRIKAMTGSEDMKARHLYANLFEFKPTFKVWFSVNSLPRVHDNSNGMWRRVRIVPFNRNFRDCADHKLADTLKAERDGILLWAIRGCEMWQAEGLQPTERMNAELGMYRESNDQIAEFIGDCCNLAKDKMVLNAGIWATYLEWTKDAGIEHPYSRGQFNRQLLSKGCTPDRDKSESRTRIWRGICLKAPSLAHLDKLDRDDGDSKTSSILLT